MWKKIGQWFLSTSNQNEKWTNKKACSVIYLHQNKISSQASVSVSVYKTGAGESFSLAGWIISLCCFTFMSFVCTLKKQNKKKHLYAFIAEVAFKCSKQEYSYSWGYLGIEKQRKGKVCAMIRTNNNKDLSYMCRDQK